jgi:hypothetical protein
MLRRAAISTVLIFVSAAGAVRQLCTGRECKLRGEGEGGERAGAEEAPTLTPTKRGCRATADRQHNTVQHRACDRQTDRQYCTDTQTDRHTDRQTRSTAQHSIAQQIPHTIHHTHTISNKLCMKLVQ